MYTFLLYLKKPEISSVRGDFGTEISVQLFTLLAGKNTKRLETDNECINIQGEQKTRDHLSPVFISNVSGGLGDGCAIHEPLNARKDGILVLDVLCEVCARLVEAFVYLHECDPPSES